MGRRPTTIRNGLRRAVAPALALAAFLGAGTAAATPEFPQAVDMDLMLTKSVETIFPGAGCRLCHPTESPPSTNPPLKSFGALVFQYGALPDNTDSLKAALATMQTNEPWLIEDLQMGMDPNLDPHQPSHLPTPEYGCSASHGTGAPAPWGWVGGLLLVPLLALRRRQRSQ
jgi:MYXO-CTERM domain-containing protein